jgi:hypothetical protein
MFSCFLIRKEHRSKGLCLQVVSMGVCYFFFFFFFVGWKRAQNKRNVASKYNAYAHHGALFEIEPPPPNDWRSVTSAHCLGVYTPTDSQSTPTLFPPMKFRAFLDHRRILYRVTQHPVDRPKGRPFIEFDGRNEEISIK